MGKRNDSTRLSNHLREWRIKVGWTIEETSGITGVSISALSRIERGERGVSPRTRVLIARRLGVPVHELFDVEEIPEEDAVELQPKPTTPRRVRDTLTCLVMVMLAPLLLLFAVPRERSGADDLERLLDIDDLAAMCGVPRRTVERWVYEGTAPPSLKLGRHRRWRLSAVLAWWDARQAS